jgi:hypothetical protein
MPTIKQPTTIPEFRRLANAFLTGSRYPSGSEVYIVMSTRGLRPINQVIPVDSKDSEAAIDAALKDPSPAGFTDEERGEQVVYRVTVPDVTRLNHILVGPHGWSGCRFLKHRHNADAPPEGASLERIKSTSLHITWDNGKTSVYDFPPETDAIGLTRGAAELFALTVYQATYGDDYVRAFRARLR